jgi:hypothetical protein
LSELNIWMAIAAINVQNTFLYGSKLFDNMEAPLEARVKIVWRFSDRAYTDIYALKGFSDGSPDFGGGASVFLSLDKQLNDHINYWSKTELI